MEEVEEGFPFPLAFQLLEAEVEPRTLPRMLVVVAAAAVELPNYRQQLPNIPVVGRQEQVGDPLAVAGRELPTSRVEQRHQVEVVVLVVLGRVLVPNPIEGDHPSIVVAAASVEALVAAAAIEKKLLQFQVEEEQKKRVHCVPSIHRYCPSKYLVGHSFAADPIDFASAAD